MDRYATDAEVESITANQDIHAEWWEIPAEELRHGVLALSYLDASGASFYLPAYLHLALDDVGKRRLWVLDLIDTSNSDDELGHRAYLEGRLSGLTDAQRKACVHVLQFLRTQLINDISRQDERQRIEGILQDSFWRSAV